MSFDQHPADDSRANDTQGDDTTGRIHGAGDNTAHLPAHPRPQPAYGDPQQRQPPPPPHQQNPYAPPSGTGRPTFGGGQPDGQQYGQQHGPQQYGQQQGQQHGPRQYGQQQYGGPPAQGAYAAPSYTNDRQQGGGQQGGFPGGPYDSSNGTGNGSGTGRPKRSKRWAAVPVAAVLAAILASGGTYALTKNDASSTASGGSTTVMQANPADFGNAGIVNWAATANKVTPSVVSITVRSGNRGDQGSGVILDKDGNIVTNNHVVAGAGDNAKVTVTLADNRTYDAKVVGTDVSTDLAVVKLVTPPDDLKPITLGDDSKLVVGQPVMAVGNPLGLAGTVTTGIVSALNRPITTQPESPGGSGQNPFGSPQQQQPQNNSSTTNAIQTSAAINPGNSGGALVTGAGKLIGINSSIATLGQSSGSSQAGNIGIGFAIPVSVVKNITSQLMATGTVKHAQIGVGVDPNPATVKVGNATLQAAKIVKVNPGSPADKAGLKAGDDVIKFNGHQIGSPPADSLIGYVRAHNVGDKITLTIVRDGKQQNVSVTLGEASPA